MIIRNGILSTVRSKGKTVLFTLLIFVLTLSLGLGLGLWSYCTLTLQSMEETYTSIAVVEYMGDQYPEEYVADEAAREFPVWSCGRPPAGVWHFRMDTSGGVVPCPMRTNW